MKPNKNISKIKLNKSDYPKTKSKSKIKVSLSQNKSSYNISQYIKNRNNLILSHDKNNKVKEDSSFNYKTEDKEKLIASYKTKLEKEKLINKNLWHKLNEYKSAMNKTRENYNKIMNKKQTKNEELIIITNKLSKLIEMVINFSYSMAYLRSNIYSKNKRRFNESTLAYESLNNNLKQIYNEFDQINKNLKSVKDINSKPKRSSKSPIKLDKNNNLEINNKEHKNREEKKEEINTDINNDFNENKIGDLKLGNNDIVESERICVTEIKKNSPLKESNSIDIINEEKNNICNEKINITNDLVQNLEIKNESKNENSSTNNDIKYIKINNISQVKERESIKKEELNENNNEKTTKSSINTNSEKIFTFRNNSQISKDGSEKINLGDSLQPVDINIDINKLIEENKNLKIQLASEKLKNNNILNNSQAESHNDEEYEEIISELKKKIEEKDNIINELNKKLNSNQCINNNSLNEIQNKNENENIFNNINVNVNLTETEKIKGNYQENINTIKNIYERILIEKENKINELNNEINIIEKELEELNDKYDKEKENYKLSLIKINELENEKISLLTEIKNLKNSN